MIDAKPVSAVHGVRPGGSDTQAAFTRLRPLLAPDSVAIVGASSTPGKYGNTVLRYLQNAGFKGRIYPINPEGGVHDGLQYYKSIADVPETIDCAFTVIPAAATPGVVKQAAAAGVRAMILGAAGFAEMGSEAGRRRQAEIVETASAAGMIVLGPNTNGIWNAHHGYALGYNTSHGEPMRKGPVSIAAHSGALFDSFIPRLARLGCGFAKLVPLGNEATLDMLEMLEALIEDPETGVIGLIMEAIRDGERLRALAARAHAAGKPVFALKLGRSTAGAAAAIAHSSRLAGSFRAYEALLRECGIPIVRSIETLAATCTIASDRRALQISGDTRLIGISGSGGGCSLMADHAAERGIALAGAGDGTWSGQTLAHIAGFEGTGLIRNPIDSGNLHGWDKLPGLLDAMARDGHNGPIAGFAHRLPTIAGDMSMLTPIAQRKARTGSPAVLVSPGGLRPEMQSRYADAGIPVLSDLAACFDSLRALYDAIDYARERATHAGSTPPLLAPDKVARARDIIASTSGDFLPEIESAELLRLAGVPMVESRIVESAAEARRAAEAIGLPVVLKAIAPDIAHKNDAGLVAIGLATPAAVAAAFDHLAARVAPGSARFVVQPQVPARAEIILGTTHEPGLGHFLLAGLGGVHAEVLDTVVLLPVPITSARIAQRISASRLGALLARLHKSGASDPTADVVAALTALQSLVLAVPDAIHSIDVNPMLVEPTGATAVDALIVPCKPATERRA